MEDDRIFVAVGLEIEECRMAVEWAAKNAAKLGGNRIVLLHVFQSIRNDCVEGWHEKSLHQYWSEKKQKEEIDGVLSRYGAICCREMLNTEMLATEEDDIARGILQQVSKRGIRKLVMGVASDKSNSIRYRKPTSVKANIVLEEAPHSCRIWFIGGLGGLVYIRETGSKLRSPSSVENSGISQSPPPSSRWSIIYEGSISPLVNKSNETVRHKQPEEAMAKVEIAQRQRSDELIKWQKAEKDAEQAAHKLEEAMAKVEIAQQQRSDELVKRQKAEKVADQAARKLDEAMAEVEIAQQQRSDELVKRQKAEKVADQATRRLEEAMAETEIAQRQLSDELVKRQKAEKVADHATHKAKAAEASYAKEWKLRKEIEQQLESLRNEKLQVSEELQKKLSAAEGLLVTIQRERDELLRERKGVMREVEEMRRQRKQKEAASRSWGPLNFTEYQFSELKEATNDLGIKIGKGGYGSVYKGQLGETQVAVKILDPQSMQGGSEFQQEIDVLSKVRHPNLVALIGACPEHRALVYEYLPNGSLKDRLDCKGNTTPLSWQIRTRIAFEICLALSFLHSRKPESIVHGDLKPDNILLDSNLVSKLGDFGLCRLILRGEDSKATVRLLTELKGTVGYIDPEFAATGELTPQSDVYSYGIILLQLLTGKPPKGLKDQVEEAMKNDSLQSILDQKAGGWPFVQAKQLVDIALKCCKMKRRSRPDLATVVCKFFEKMMTLAGSSASSSQLSTSLDSALIPSHFVCPISLEIMRDPHFAADGFTYEANEIRKWLNNNNTSPMTNIPLSHTELTPNWNLKSAIQTWLQVRRS